MDASEAARTFGPYLVGIGGLFFSFLAHRQATRANDRSMTLQASGAMVEERRLSFDQFQKHIENLQADLTATRELLTERDRQYDALEARYRTLQEQYEAAQRQQLVAQEQVAVARRENRELMERMTRMEQDMRRLMRSELRPGGQRHSDPPTPSDEFPI